MHPRFPFLLGGTFIEAFEERLFAGGGGRFPFLLGGTFIEAAVEWADARKRKPISLPFGRDFH